MNKPPQERLVGLDLIRIFCFFCIVAFHVSTALWPYDAFPDRAFPVVLSVISKIARVGDFSGFAVLFLTSFLAGIKGRSPLKHRNFFSLFLFFSWIVFNFLTWLQEGDDFQVVWDIYPLILIGYLSADRLLFSYRMLSFCTVGLSVLWLSMPVWQWSPIMDFFPLGKKIIFGLCPDDYADWPILPWIGLIWIGLFLGKTYNMLHIRYGSSFWRMRFWEVFIWPPLCFFFLLYHPLYVENPLGSKWSCYIFRQPPFAFWSQMGFLFLLVRVSLIASVKKLLSDHSFFTWVSALFINRAFYFAYFIHYLFIYVLVGLMKDNSWLPKNYTILLIFLLTFLTTEWCTRFFLKLKSVKKT